MPLQVKRLLLVFGFFIGSMIVLIHFLTPDSFYQFGHYRGKALDEISNHEAKYVDVKSCAMCHDSIAAVKDSSFHKSINCETCHGPGYKHIEDPEKNKMDKPQDREFCIICHAKNPARPQKEIKQIDAVEHNKGEVCITCHNPHKPWE